MRRAPVLVLALLALCAVLAAEPGGEAPPTPFEWRPFEGTWSAVGTRRALPTEGDRPAVIVEAKGAVTLTLGEGLSRGFEGEAIYFDDGRGQGVGRAVWTDVNGDRIFSALRGEPARTGGRIAGTITGGTGRYARLEGEYAMSFQYVLEAEEGTLQLRTTDLRGRVRRGEAPR